METIENDPQLTELPRISPVLAAIQAHIAEVHSEPPERHSLICSALMIGSPALQAELQV